ncbi:MAG: VOC family protein, partial [Fimbriimonadaceae bacterium]
VVKLAFLGFKGAQETQVELIEGYNDQLPQEGKVHHIAFTVDDIEAEIERIEPWPEATAHAPRCYRVWARITHAPFPLPLGSACDAEIVVGRKRVYRIILEH